MVGVGVVLVVGVFIGDVVEVFVDLDVLVWLQFLQVGGQGDVYDVGVDQYNVDGFVVVGGGY